MAWWLQFARCIHLDHGVLSSRNCACFALGHSCFPCFSVLLVFVIFQRWPSQNILQGYRKPYGTNRISLRHSSWLVKVMLCHPIGVGYVIPSKSHGKTDFCVAFVWTSCVLHRHQLWKCTLEKLISHWKVGAVSSLGRSSELWYTSQSVRHSSEWNQLHSEVNVALLYW